MQFTPSEAVSGVVKRLKVEQRYFSKSSVTYGELQEISKQQSSSDILIRTKFV